MRFTRKRLVTALALAALVTAGTGGWQGAQAVPWLDQLPRQSSQGGPTPNSGEPDVGSTRVQRTSILTAVPRGAASADRELRTRKASAAGWVGWSWVKRILGMGF